MNKENISTQTLLEILLNEMDHVKAYTALIKSLGPTLNAHLSAIRNEKINVDTSKLDRLCYELDVSVKRHTYIPTWFLILASIAFTVAIIEGSILYTLVFRN